MTKSLRIKLAMDKLLSAFENVNDILTEMADDPHPENSWYPVCQQAIKLMRTDISLLQKATSKLGTEESPQC